MHRKFIALISGLAVAVALTGASAAPARADGSDAAKIFAGLAALAIIGAAIDNANDHPPVINRQVIVQPPRHVYAPPRPVYVQPRPVYVQPQRNVYVERHVNKYVTKKVIKPVNRDARPVVRKQVTKEVNVYRHQPNRVVTHTYLR
ncbi:hypothetical protein [Pseudodonghicola flavimaris]|uniref:DUF1236 domain-containing protein n=1 Tax=Pseudodonghicola flavimaris TaxID=3050036 RepID=A0ABT7EX12_9RHOB|nr:hypothetical protein [Pseudodonghicola flavimaris]MDK3016820.1 hypothetical protein [Pseudodonghicola flavimaris]